MLGQTKGKDYRDRIIPNIYSTGIVKTTTVAHEVSGAYHKALFSEEAEAFGARSKLSGVCIEFCLSNGDLPAVPISWPCEASAHRQRSFDNWASIASVASVCQGFEPRVKLNSYTLQVMPYRTR